jgi:MFS family permease
MSIYILSNVIADVPLGAFSDIYGKKKTLILGTICSFLGVLTYTIGKDFWILAIGTILEGVAMACFSGNNDAIIFESVELENQKTDNSKNSQNSDSKKLDFNQEYGKIMSYFQIAMVIASLGSFLVIFDLKLANIFLSLKIIDLPLEKTYSNPFVQFWVQIKKSLLELKNNPNLSLTGLLNALEYAFAETTYYFRSNFVASLWALEYIGVSKVVSSAMATLSFRYGSQVIDKLGIKKTLIWSGFGARAIDIVATLLNNIFSPALIGISSLFYGTTTISKSSLLQNQLTTQNRSTIPSFISLLGNLIFAIFSVLFGYLTDQYGVFATFMIFQIGYLIVNIGYSKVKVE